MRIALVFVLLVLTGCSTIQERYSRAYERHPCGNIWDYCPGDNEFIDQLNKILQGK
jgi:hypothetical protein